MSTCSGSRLDYHRQIAYLLWCAARFWHPGLPPTASAGRAPASRPPRVGLNNLFSMGGRTNNEGRDNRSASGCARCVRQLSHETHFEATLALADIGAMIRFVIASSCGMKGAAGTGAIEEMGDLESLAPCVESEVRSRVALSRLADTQCFVNYMRNATAYGASRRLRLDLVLI